MRSSEGLIMRIKWVHYIGGKKIALFMRLLRMLNIALTIISVNTTHTILYCAATATVLYMDRDYWYSYCNCSLLYSVQHIIGGLLNQAGPHHTLLIVIRGWSTQ